MTYLYNRFQLNIEGIKLVIKWYGETLKTSLYMKEITHKNRLCMIMFQCTWNSRKENNITKYTTGC